MMNRPAVKRDLLILAVYLSTIARGQYNPYGENVVLEKPATQSSTYTENGFSYDASLGVDGKTSTNFSDKTCSHTSEGQKYAWWTVNLNGLFLIKFIRIYQLIKQSTHSDPGYNRLNGAKMYARMEGNTWQQIYFDSNSPPNSFDVNVTLDKLISSITLNTTERTPQTGEAFISICEMQAFVVHACSPYTIQNGRFNILKLGDAKQNFTYGAKLNVTCKEGYHISENGASVNEAEKTIECMANKTWSGNFKCSVTNCGHPPRLPDHSKVTITPGIAGTTTYNATLTIQCNEGYNYSLQDVEPLLCSSSGSWKGSLGYCKVIDCGWPVGIPGDSTITSASGLAGNTSYNTTIRVKCHEGFIYTRPGYETVRCSNDGNWNSILGTCEVVQCDLLDGVPGDSTVTSHFGLAGNTSYNATVTIKCNEGFSYTRPGKETIRCNSNGKWSSMLGTCEDPKPTDFTAEIVGSIVTFITVVALVVGIVIFMRRRKKDKDNARRNVDHIDESKVEGSSNPDEMDIPKGLKKNKRNNIPDDPTIVHKVVAGGYRLKEKEEISAYEFVEDFDIENVKSKSMGLDTNAMEPYDNLQMDNIAKSEYDELKFERESSLETTMTNETYQNMRPGV